MPPEAASQIGAPSHEEWATVGRWIAGLPPRGLASALHRLDQWPWRFRRAGHDRRFPSWSLLPDQLALRSICRVYVGDAGELEAVAQEAAFAASFAQSIRVVEIQGNAVPGSRTLRAFQRARAVINRSGPLLAGPWPAVEGGLDGALAPQVSRLALRASIGESGAWALAKLPLRGLWLDDDDPAVVTALTGGRLQTGLQQLWTGNIPVEAALATGPWPSLTRIGGRVEDANALIAALAYAPRLVSLDIDVDTPPPLDGIVAAGVQAVRLQAYDPVPLVTQAAPRQLRAFGWIGTPTPDSARALATWGPRWSGVYSERPQGLAWLGY